jgi:hypothetical protein
MFRFLRFCDIKKDLDDMDDGSKRLWKMSIVKTYVFFMESFPLCLLLNKLPLLSLTQYRFYFD